MQNKLLTVVLLSVITVGLCGQGWSAGYESYISNMTAAQSNELLGLLDSEISDEIILSLKRIADLKIYTCRSKVAAMIPLYLPTGSDDYYSVQQKETRRTIFFTSIMTISQIGINNDADYLYWLLVREIKRDDIDAQRVIVMALGQMKGVKAAVSNLNKLTEVIYERPLVNTLLTAVEMHSSKSSIKYLNMMVTKPQLSFSLKNRIETLMGRIARSGLE